MPDYEKLVDTSNRGLACLCFANKARLTLAEITEIFSEYGDVVGINCSGNESGFRFVRFRKKEEALRCAIALDEHPKIQLQPVRSKFKESDDNSQPNQIGRNKRDNVNNRRINQISCNAAESDIDSTKGSQSSRNSRLYDNQKPNGDNGSRYDLDGINLAKSESITENCNDLRHTINDQNSRTKYSNLRSVQNSPRAEFSVKRNETKNLNNNLNALKLAQLHRLRGTIANTFQPSNSDLMNNVPAPPVVLPSSPIILSPPSSHHSSKEQSIMADRPPPLVSGVPSMQSSRINVPDKQVEVLPASDVIVANIHSNFGVSNIYDMLRKFSPIWVSDIETVPDINVRFCYVYFKTPKNALEVEQLFDGALLHGKKLITLRPYRLEVESGV